LEQEGSVQYAAATYINVVVYQLYINKSGRFIANMYKESNPHWEHDATTMTGFDSLSFQFPSYNKYEISHINVKAHSNLSANTPNSSNTNNLLKKSFIL
jgi:hypothetical protein